jgi:hypothetical protein
VAEGPMDPRRAGRVVNTRPAVDVGE